MSESVTDKHSQWSDSGPIKISVTSQDWQRDWLSIIYQTNYQSARARCQQIKIYFPPSTIRQPFLSRLFSLIYGLACETPVLHERWNLLSKSTQEYKVFFLKWVSPKHFSRLPLPPKQIEMPGPHLVQWPPLGLSLEFNLGPTGPPFCALALNHLFSLWL